jgi:hypothetical protein
LSLPAPVNARKASQRLSNGVLVIGLPKPATGKTNAWMLNTIRGVCRAAIPFPSQSSGRGICAVLLRSRDHVRHVKAELLHANYSTLLAPPQKRHSSAATLPNLRTWRSSPVNRAFRNARTRSSMSLGPITRAPRQKDIHVVELHTLVGRVDVVAHGCTNTAHFIRCNRHSHSTAADQQSALATLCDHFFGHGSGVIGIVVGRRRSMRPRDR